MWTRNARAKARASSGIQKLSLSSAVAGSSSTPVVQVASLTADGRRVKRSNIPVLEPPSPVKRLRQAPRPGGIDQLTDQVFGDAYESILAKIYDDDDLTAAVNQGTSNVVVVEEVKSRRRYLSSDEPLKQWTPYRDEYLAELLRIEGRGDVDTERCPWCKQTFDERDDGDVGESFSYRCLDCFGEDLMCKGCCVKRHESNPLHIIERWNGLFFEEVSLKGLGLVVYLGTHKSGDTCNQPRMVNSFTVVHVNGLHSIRIAYCNCDKLRADPRTCVTYEVLNHFHVMTLQGKVTTYDYYNGLEKLRNNANLKKTKAGDRYKAFARVIRQWRHLKMLKRAGRGNDASRPVEETKNGELAVRCIACPTVGVNLPPSWLDASIEERFKYFLFLAMDACFRLKRRMVSSEARDPALGSGWSYMVEDKPFRAYLLSVTDQDEMSTCSGLAALEQANTKNSRGYSSTGVGVGVCARHEIVQANGAVDLQKGERYANMDYVFASLLGHHDHRLTKVQSYDIVCQWCKKLVDCLKKLPPLVRLNLVLHLIYFVIPKLHIYGHQIHCQLMFSLNWLQGAGRTDGEGIERPWAHMGPVATSTRDMGPGSRHDTLDDHWGHWNFVKMTGLGSLLLRRLLTAIYERLIHTRALKEFTESQGSVTEQWKKMIQDWEEELSLLPAERKKANPFELPKSGLTEAEIKLELTQLEAEQERAGIPAIHTLSPTSFISQGLELEEQQRALKLDLKNNRFDTATQKTILIQRRTKLQRAIGKFRSVQATYMPGAIQYLAQSSTAPDSTSSTSGSTHDISPELPEDIPLCLPSGLPSSYRLDGCRPGLFEIERKLREGQLCNSLSQLRNHLHMKSRLLTYRTSNVAHQGVVTRSKAIFNRNQRQIDQCALKYQMAWAAMANLAGNQALTWKKLENNDIRLMDGSGDRAIGVVRKQKGKKSRDQEKAGKETPVETEEAGEEEEEDELAKEKTLQERLRDVRNMVGEGTREVSWIWKEGGTGEAIDDEALEESKCNHMKESIGILLTSSTAVIRVEWCKAFARAKRWQEEVVLVKEEMRRCLVTLEYNALQWDGRCEYEGPLAKGASAWKDEWKFSNSYVGPLNLGTDSFHREGVRAYAHSQAGVYRSLASRFRKQWAGMGDKERDIEEGIDISRVIRASNASMEESDDEDASETIQDEDIEVLVEVDDDDAV
ncbi:hypothetical protein K435DRAFT_818886 [Dendrothele bispora CBS 962.96]|uniref:CxC2-like cysteine cluster KDZ transposase-associated domain-containing protein n=1 Tax=Dendrothele bispora (strain CBS 962.96) TaxID=1314807 RepID=A0A4S8M7W5_DENBC|nr:hypothetical protein K435DRAFT_818886 [Dendrothele bispora CBS 962.96]